MTKLRFVGYATEFYGHDKSIADLSAENLSANFFVYRKTLPKQCHSELVDFNNRWFFILISFVFWWLSAIHLSIVIRKRTLIISSPRLRCQMEASMSRPSQTGSAYVQVFLFSSDFRAFMSRLTCAHQIFVRSPDFRAFMCRLSCVQQIFVRLCPDVHAFFRVSRLCKFESTTPPSGTSTWVCFQCYLLIPPLK